jgi:Mn2+/Fe2+ NRAMP family transporter
VAAAPFLVVVLIIANDRKLMGAKHVNGRVSNALVGLTIALMTLAAIVLIATGGG